MNLPVLEEQQEDEFEHFTITGTVRVEGSPAKTKIFRDTGAIQSLILKGAFQWTEKTSKREKVECRIEGGKFKIPLHKIWLDCRYVTGEVTMGVETMSIDGVEMLIGNDLAGKRIIPDLKMVEEYHSSSCP